MILILQIEEVKTQEWFSDLPNIEKLVDQRTEVQTQVFQGSSQDHLFNSTLMLPLTLLFM